jgi:hypothetical protein
LFFISFSQTLARHILSRAFKLSFIYPHIEPCECAYAAGSSKFTVHVHRDLSFKTTFLAFLIPSIYRQTLSRLLAIKTHAGGITDNPANRLMSYSLTTRALWQVPIIDRYSGFPAHPAGKFRLYRTNKPTIGFYF